MTCGGCRGLMMSGVSLSDSLAGDSLVRSLRLSRTRVKDAAGMPSCFEIRGTGQKTSAACGNPFL